MQPGIYRGISNEDYHSGPGDSKSGLDLVRRSPALYRATKTGQRKRKSTKAQLTGTAIHAMVLEPDLVAETYALPFAPPAGTLVTMDEIKAALEADAVDFKKSAKKSDLEAVAREYLHGVPLYTDERAKYEAENEGKVIIEPEEWLRLENMLAAVRAHPAAMKLLSAPGEAELSCYWNEPVIDPATGEHVRNADGTPAYRLMRCRPDFLQKSGIVVDLKSTSPEGGSAEEFARSIDNWRYYVQDPLYSRGITAALAASDDPSFADFQPVRAFVFVVVETDACVVDGVAMGVSVYQLQPDSVALGDAEIREDIHTLHTCDTTGKWPGYSPRIEPIDLPAYAFTRAAARVAA